VYVLASAWNNQGFQKEFGVHAREAGLLEAAKKKKSFRSLA
jgi:hypothetical protein